MPRFNINGNLSRMDTKRQQQFENDASQQELDMRQQNGMVGQLAQLYGISNDAQMSPARLAQMQAQTRGVNAGAASQEFANSWAQPNAEAAFAHNAAQTAALQAGTQSQQLQNDWAPHNYGLASQEHEAALARGQMQDKYLPAQLENQLGMSNIALQGAGLDLKGKQSDYAWEEPFKQQKFDLGQGQNDLLHAQAKHINTSNPYISTPATGGVFTPQELFELLATPEQRQNRAVSSVALEQKRLADVATEEARLAKQPKKKALFDDRSVMPTFMPTFPY